MAPDPRPLTAADGGPQCPPGLRWALITTNATGELTFCNPAGQRFTFDPSDVPHLAAALADHCDDNPERSFVAGRWSPVDDWDEDDAEEAPDGR